MGVHGQPAKDSLQVARPSELKVPAQPFAEHERPVPQIAGVAAHAHPEKAPLQVAMPSGSKVCPRSR